MKIRFILVLLLLAALAVPAQAQLKATVTWDAVTTYSDGSAIETDKIVHYSVWRALAQSGSAVPDASAYQKVGDVEVLQFVDSVQPNKIYFYQLSAYLVSGNDGARSDPVAFKTLPPGKVGRVVVVVTN